MVTFCTHFIPPKRLHIYRQVCAITDYENWVVTRHRRDQDRFPYERVHVLRKSPVRFLSRLWHQARHTRYAPLDRFEVDQLLAFTRARGAAVFHAYFGTEAARLLRYFERETRAKVVSFLGLDVTEAVLPARDLERLLASVDLFLCFSQSLADILRRRGCPPERLRLNTPGVPLPEGDWSRGPLPPPSPERPLRLLQACRFVQKKGLDVSLRCLAILRDRGVPARLTLVGEGPERDALGTQARELGVLDLVRFPGFLDFGRLVGEMREHDLFLHPSRTASTGDVEGIPSVILEAMAYGLPVISSRHGGIPEVITDGVDGLLIAEAEPEPLARAVVIAATEPDLYARLSRRARRRVEAEYSVGASVGKLQTHLREAVRIGRARGATEPVSGSG